MNKRKKHRKVNRGNSFIIVITTISFLAVLTTSLLVAVAACFRIKAYDINSRDNFYYLEQAMDEIYDGVGDIAMKHLNEAYNETAEVMVYYDPVNKAYVTMSDSDANKLMEANFKKKLSDDTSLSAANKVATLKGMISYPYVAGTRDDGVKLSVGNIAWDGDSYVIKDLVLKRTAQYSTYNTSRGPAKAAPSAFVQSLTTDLVITKPDFNINFTKEGEDSSLYGYTIISDMGAEFNDIGTKVNINGNVYAAADFYNKVYNDTAATKVNSYSDDDLKKCDGVREKSMYSGFYVNGAKVSVMAEDFVVPGSVASMNCGELSVMGSPAGTDPGNVNIWADSLILGGYSRKQVTGTNNFRGSTLNISGNAYISDDLEVNAAGSQFKMNGNYYGYNYATTDNRTYTAEFISRVKKDATTGRSASRTYTKDVKINDGNFITDDGSAKSYGQAHYNSSSIIVNGMNSSLDLSGVDNIYIAGQAYVELSKSKSAESKTYEAVETGDKIELKEVTATTDPNNLVEVDVYQYNKDKSNTNYTSKKDAYSDTDSDSVQDYRTGEGLTVKSNQLAYIPPYEVKEDTDGSLYVDWYSNIQLRDDSYFSKIWNEEGASDEEIKKKLQKVPVIKTVVAGSDKPFYFYDLSKARVGMNEFMEHYAKMFEDTAGTGMTAGDLADFYDITDYDAFKAKKIDVDWNKIYSNSAISVLSSGKVDIKADSKIVAPLISANDSLTDGTKITSSIEETSDVSLKKTYAANVTLGLQKEYKAMKLLLDRKDADAGTAYTTDEDSITPINYYFDFSKLPSGVKTHSLPSGSKVFLGDGDIKVTGADKIKGIVICKGNVTFDPTVKEFEGMVICGGKVIVEHSINFVANAELIKSILKECDESRNLASTEQHQDVCEIFRKFTSIAVAPAVEDGSVSAKSVSAVLYEDMLSYRNWKKNVD